MICIGNDNNTEEFAKYRGSKTNCRPNAGNSANKKLRPIDIGQNIAI